MVQASLSRLPAAGQSKSELEQLQRLLKVPALQVPTPCSGHQSIPEMGQLAPPAHLPIEKERARLQVQPKDSASFCICLPLSIRLVRPPHHQDTTSKRNEWCKT